MTYTLGIDIGSTTTKAVITKNAKVISYNLVPTGSEMNEAEKNVVEKTLFAAKISLEQIDAILTTGYGRIRSSFTDNHVTEIKAMGRGALALFPKAQLLVDIGGQDSKAIRLANGRVIDFRMNDRCAAGTGRFLELMSRVLKVNLEQMSDLAKKSKEPIAITSTCAVFAESEVISLISKGVSKPDIITGIYNSIARRVGTLAKTVGIEKEVVFSGGVAKSPMLAKSIEKTLNHKVKVPKEPQILGALGAALIANENRK
jgi:predicted CoA-substrate-specific enzyme activase